MNQGQKDSRRDGGRRFQRKPVRPRKSRMPKNQLRNDDDFNWGKVLKVVLSWSAIIFGVFILVTLFRTPEANQYEIDYTKYLELLNEKRISSATIKKSELNNYEFYGTLNAPIQLKTPSGKTITVERFIVMLPFLDTDVVQSWTDKDIRFTITREDNTWMNALLSALPWVLLLVVWLIIMRRMQGVGTKGIFSFGKSRAKMKIGRASC